DDSQNGQSPATERVREQINQSLDFIPSALCNGLHDARLEPTNRAPDFLPWDGVPVGRRLGSRTSRHFCRRPICLSPSVGWPRFSRDGTPEGSQPAFAARGCRPWADSPFMPGSREVLLPPRPLRTGRESCPSSSSSIHERPSRDAAALVRRSWTWICRWQLACSNSMLSVVSVPPRLRQTRWWI